MRPLRRDSGRHAITRVGPARDRVGWPAVTPQDRGQTSPRRPPSVQAASEDLLRKVTIGELAVLAGPVELVDYDPQWPDLFERLAADIRRALGDRVRLLEHAGSTSVPSLAAKPIVDMVLAVADSSDEGSYVPALETLGYVLRIREPEWFEHRVLKRTDPAVNLHVFTEYASEISKMLAFRDWLRGHDDDRLLYEQTKRELAAREWKYVQHYADAKTEVVEAIVARAASAAARLLAAIEGERRRLARGERPLYHVTWVAAAGGAVDVTIRELPIIHLFVPDSASVLDGARLLIARTLETDPASFEVAVADP